MATNPNPITGLPLSGGTITGLLTLNNGLLVSSAAPSQFFSATKFSAGTDTHGSAPLLTPTNVNGTPAQLADVARDYMIYLTVGAAGTAFSVAIGPTAGLGDTLISGAAVAAGQLISFRLPADWFWQWSATTATLASQVAIGC